MKNTKNNFVFGILIFIFCIFILPGIAFLSIYLSPDVRFTASEWMYKNIPENAKILSETANVIDIPVPSLYTNTKPNNYYLKSFNFYDLDNDKQLQKDLSEALKEAGYIIVPSRRIFKNHPEEQYPILNKYYEQLFSERLGFEKIAEFSSYPHISIFGKTLIEFPDENAEETWTVFDHPVIRIYKKIQAPHSNLYQSQITNLKTDFSKYAITDYKLAAINYKLLVADTPERWEKGLMYVENKADIGGQDGMIFIFPESQKREFWNKNTLSNLTLYWIDNNKVIGSSDLPSITETGIITTVSSPSPADTVIEIIK